MDLWIRSQDREQLTKVTEVRYEYYRPFFNETRINTIIINNDLIQEYKTKERALEVLDEIHNILKPKGIVKFASLLHDKDLAKIKEKLNDEYLVFGQNVELIQQPTTYVYEMPLE